MPIARPPMSVEYYVSKGAHLASATSATALVVFLPRPEVRGSFGANIFPRFSHTLKFPAPPHSALAIFSPDGRPCLYNYYTITRAFEFIRSKVARDPKYRQYPNYPIGVTPQWWKFTHIWKHFLETKPPN